LSGSDRGVFEYGVVEYWSVGVLEYWSGVMELMSDEETSFE